METPPTRRRLFASTGARLAAAFAGLLALFAAALVVMLATLGRLAAADAQQDRLDHAKHTGHKAAALIRELNIQQLQVILGEEHATVESYGGIAEVTRKATAELAHHTRDDEERRLAENIHGLALASDERFRREMVPALARGDRAAAVQAHVRSSGETTRAVQMNEHLNMKWEHASAHAHDHAATLRRQTRAATLGFFGLAIGIAAAVGLAMSRSIGRRVAVLREGARRVGSGDLAARITLGGSDELSELAGAFNQMTSDLARHQAQLIQAQKLASIGEVAAGVAHEINNPLGVILGYARLMPASEESRIIADEAVQCQRIVEGLLDLARPPKLELAEVDLADLARDTLGRLEDAGRLDGQEVHSPPPEVRVVVHADEGKLRQVLWNIVLNAAEAAPAGGRVTVDARRDGQDAVLAVADDGPGMPPEVRGRVFEPFFTTKAKGTGLGLAIAQAIAAAHGGRIEVESEPGRGTQVSLRLPLLQEAASS